MASVIKTEVEDDGQTDEEVTVSAAVSAAALDTEPEDKSTSSTSPEPEAEVAVKLRPTMLNMNRVVMSGGHQPATRVPIFKQMEQMMSRNYSDFMRSLAAKYNNRNPAEEEQEESFNLNHVNGFMHKLEQVGRMGEAIIKASTPPLLNDGGHHDDVIRKTDNHSAPPALFDHHQKTASGGQLLRPMVDLSSTQMLLHMMRSASSAAAPPPHPPAAPESSMATSGGGGGHGSMKRSADAEDALDLSVKCKRWRVDGCGLPVDPIGLLSRTSGQRGRLNSNNNNNNNSSRASFESFADLSRSSLPDTISADVMKKSNARAVATNVQRKQQQQTTHVCVVNCPCSSDRKNATSAVVKWNVDDVCAFVSGVDACADYVQAFRDHSIDGGALYMLTEDHLTNRMKMKLGHALRFKAALAKLIGACAVCLHCVHCHQPPQQPQQSNGGGALQRQS